MYEVFELGKDERDRRWKMVRKAMGKRGLGALVVWGFPGYNSLECANFRYLSNMPSFGCLAVPGYFIFPFDGEPTIVGFAKMPGELFWVTDIRGKRTTYSNAVLDRLRELNLERARIGIVSISGSDSETGFPYATFLSLRENLPGAYLEDATDILKEPQMIKSDAEIRCFELGCEAANKAIQAVVDIGKPGVRDFEVVAKILETLVRNGCEPDSLFLYGSGKKMIHGGMGQFLHPRYLKTLESGDIIHIEFDAKYNGYVAQHNQPLSVGAPDKEWSKISDVAAEAFNNGLKALKPGITLGELDEAFLSVIRESGYQSQNCSFHGLGLTTDEPMASSSAHQETSVNVERPSCIPSDSFIIRSGMVLEFEPHVITRDRKKGFTIGCPILVTETGCRSLNKSWEPLLRRA